MRKEQYQFGIFSWFGYRLHMAERAKLIRNAGFSVTSLWWGEEEKANTGSLHDLPAIVRDAGLIIDNIHVPFEDANDLFSDIASTRRAAVDKHISWLNDCARHNVTIMVMHTCYQHSNSQPSKHLTDSLKKMLKEAEKLDVVIAIENVRCRKCLDFAFSEIDSPRLGFCYDSSHDWIFSDNKTDVLKTYGRRLVTNHLSDNDGLEDRHWFPGDGVVDWHKIAQAFPKQKCSGRLLLEILPKDKVPKEPPEVFIAEAYKSLTSIAELFKER
jgi:sugar phosphate isomerase/epimerase